MTAGLGLVSAHCTVLEQGAFRLDRGLQEPRRHDIGVEQ